MTVSAPGYLKSLFNNTAALGDKAVSSDATMEIEGYEDITLLIKQFPWPELSPAGEIEVPMPMGAARWQPQQLKVNQQGQITFMETVRGSIARALQEIQKDGGRFNAVVYEGTPDRFTKKERISDCFVQLDNPDRDFENRAQVLLVSGTIFFHYFGSED
jgi:hypothetical protein